MLVINVAHTMLHYINAKLPREGEFVKGNGRKKLRAGRYPGYGLPSIYQDSPIDERGS